MPRRRQPPPSIHSPRLWGTWCLVAWGWLLARLPLALLWPLGRRLGWLAFHLARHRRHVTQTNLQACFPHLGQKEVRALAKRTFAGAGQGVLETCIAWLHPGCNLASRFHLAGTQHFHAAMSKGRGLLLLGAHFTVLDIACQPLAALGKVDVMYRKNRNPVWERIQVRGRRRWHQGVIERKDLRGALRSLKAGRALWYAADQDYGPKHSVFAPFFALPAATITAPARLARHNQTPMLLLTQHRNPESRTWTLEFKPLPDGFPSGDAVQDATTLNQALEAAVRLHPDQYLWLHRRFKTRPPGEPSLY